MEISEHTSAIALAHYTHSPCSILDEFLEKFQTTFDRPTPSFCENYISILFMMNMVAYIQGGMVAR